MTYDTSAIHFMNKLWMTSAVPTTVHPIIAQWLVNPQLAV